MVCLPQREAKVHLHLAPLVPSSVPLGSDTAVSISESTATSGSSIWLNAPQVLPQSGLCKSAKHLTAFQPSEMLAEVSQAVHVLSCVVLSN